jgi:hypothetical protein
VGQGFVITLDANGKLVVMGQMFGAYTFVGGILSITDSSGPECMMPGKYSMAFSANCGTVTATLVSEPCVERGMALTTGPWTRQ